MGNFLVRYGSRVVIYYRRAVVRLATGLEHSNWLKSIKWPIRVIKYDCSINPC